MSYCVNKNDPQYKLNLMNLTKILGNSNAAIAALELNGGYSLDKTPSGQESLLFQSCLSNILRKYPDLTHAKLIQKATILKLLTQLKENVNENPVLIGDYFISKEELNLIGLIKYLGLKLNRTEEEINRTVLLYLQRDSYAVNYVKELLDRITIRLAQLHTMGYDFNKESYLPDGSLDWNSYLGGINLYHELTENDLYLSELLLFSPIYDYQVDPAEIIMPKIYRSNYKIGGYDLTEIDEDFFKKVNPFYLSDLKQIKKDGIVSKAKIDFIVRCHNYKFNIIVSDSLSHNIEGLNPIKVFIQDGYRLDKFGNKMYKLPEDNSTYLIYSDNKGNETIIFKKEGNEIAIKALLLSLNKLDLVSVLPLLENVDVTENWLNYIININKLDTYDHALHTLAKQVSTLSLEELRKQLSDIYITSKKAYETDLANTLYNSFIRTLYVISVRIPTQAFQSIMAAKVVGLTDDRSNNIFVSRWLFWLQGSDLDIDKSYIMGADVNKFGKYNHWSPISNYTTRKLAEISDKLPIPNQTFIVTPENYFKVDDNLTPIIIRESVDQDSVDGKLLKLMVDYDLSYSKEPAIIEALLRTYNIAKVPKLKDTIRLTILQKVLEYIKPGKEYNLPTETLQLRSASLFINKINKHNSHIITAEEARNIVLDRILKISLDERNMLAGYSPIDLAMDYFRNALKEIEDTASIERDLDDGGLSIARIQYDNSVGKKDVGIMANGLKAFFALTQYLNKYRKDPNLIHSNRYFLTKLDVNGKENYFSSISDIQFEQEAIKILNEALHIYCPDVKDNLKLANKDASLLISSLISLATDNAKELALAKMNASVNLACMHLFLVVMGYDAKEVTKFTTSPEFSYLAKQLNSSKFNNETPSVNSILKNILTGKDKNAIGDLTQYENIRFIYQCALEMSNIAQIGAINQGTKVDELEAAKFFNKLKTIIREQINAVLSISDLKVSINNYTIALSAKDEQDPIKELINKAHNIESELLENELRHKLEILNQENIQNHYMQSEFTIDMDRYFSDENYRQFCTDLYNLFKFNFNVLDCINNLPHFYEMLHAFTIAETTITKASSRSRAVINESIKGYVPYRLYTRAQVVKYNSFNGETSTETKVVYNTKPFNESVQRKASRFFDDFILSEYLMEFGNKFTINYAVDSDDTSSRKIIVPNTNDGIIDFCNFIAYYVIPNLQEKFPKNTFLAYIRPDFRKVSKGKQEVFLPKYKFNFDIDSLTTVADQNKAFYILTGFNELSNITLNDLDFDISEGNNISIAELLYLYDKITSLSGFGQDSLDRAFELYVAKNVKQDIIAKQLSKIVLEHDRHIRPDITFDPLLFTAFCYANQIRIKQKGIAKFDVVWDPSTKKWDETNAHKIDISKKFLFNLDNVENYQKLILQSEKLIKLLVSESINNPEIVTVNDTSVWKITSPVDKTLEIYFPAGLDNSFQGFVQDLYNYSTNDPESYDILKLQLIDFEDKINKQAPKLKSFETLAVYKKFKQRMLNLGVNVEIDDKSTSGQNGRVENGIIFLNPNSNVTTTPMHELMHMVIAVMKESDYTTFERLMDVARKNSKIENIFNELSASEEYGSLMELDRMEEALCRYFETLATIDPRKATKSDMSKEEWDIFDTILNLINPYISKTLGIAPPEKLIVFLNDTISMLPTYNSTLFVKTENDSTGYLSQKEKIIRSVRLTSYIESLIAAKTLKEVEC